MVHVANANVGLVVQWYSTDGVGCHCHGHGGGGGGGEGATTTTHAPQSTTVLAKVHCGEMAGIYFGDKRLGGNGGKQQASMQ